MSEPFQTLTRKGNSDDEPVVAVTLTVAGSPSPASGERVAGQAKARSGNRAAAGDPQFGGPLALAS